MASSWMKNGDAFKDELLKARIKSFKIFLEDYKKNPDYYIPAELPKLPFKDDEFHLLFRKIYCSRRRALATDSI